MDEQRMAQILTSYCNPDYYDSDNEIKELLQKRYSKETLTSIRLLLGEIIANPNLSDREKVKKYFGLYIDNEKRAKELLNRTLGNLSV